MTITKITEADFEEWLNLALELWPDYDKAEMESALTGIHESPQETAYLLRNEEQTAIGFINLSLRYDYVPGATQKPVAYVESIYVRAAYQRQALGKMLIQHAEAWAAEQRCSELASDVLLDNEVGQAFHKQVGFEEVDRVVNFIKTL